MKNVTLESFGPIAEAHVEFGDLTVLVGQQASGKSIFIQLMKLLVDKHHIRKTLEQYSYVWSKDTDKILEWYFGEGMSGVWKSQSTVTMDGKDYTKEFLLPKSGRTGNTVKKEETMFYIPAQRIRFIARTSGTLPSAPRFNVRAKSIPDTVRNTGAVNPRSKCQIFHGYVVISSCAGATSASSVCPCIIIIMAIIFTASSMTRREPCCG
ncbi:MAG: AAA family ATPase [Candidatus Kapabacteria bacterium]|nr:AAA family ATPase [Candidatus Kapabacteria bacterium]